MGGTAARMLILIGLILLVACQPQEDSIVLPTSFSVDALATADAAATQTAQPTATNTLARQLPPSWTPTPSPTPTPTDPASVPTTTPEGFNPSGTIFYIYNGDSIVRISGDGTNSQLIITFGVGQRISDLTISPDGRLLAFVAPGVGSAREVYVSNRDGTAIWRVSCLGFSEVFEPSWSPDSRKLVFIASQSPITPYDLYETSWEGAETCPTGNGQRQLLGVGSALLRDVTYDPGGFRVFFSNDTIFALDLRTGNVSGPLTQTIGFGPDFGLTFNPINRNELTYLRAGQNPLTGAAGGTVFRIDVTSTQQFPTAESLASTLAQFISWSRDGRSLLISAPNTVLVYEARLNSTRILVSSAGDSPQAVFDPWDTAVAFVGTDPGNPAVEQVFVLNRSSSRAVQLTEHPEGTVSSPVWVEN